MSRIHTWANGFGVWHVRVPRYAAYRNLTAAGALRKELQPRESKCSPDVWQYPVRVHELDDSVSVVYRERFLDTDPPVLGVHYTGDVITRDGSDTGVYGDPTEPGDGSSMESGWIDLDWDRYQVHENRDDVRADVYDPEDTDGIGDPIDPVTWLVKTVTDRMGWIETELGGVGTVFYASQADETVEGDRSVSLAAHPFGFTDEQIEAALNLFRLIRKGQYTV